MANTNKQNPLKTFNDNYAARAKKVVEGNKKLVKAQVGLSNIQGPVTEGTAWKQVWSDYFNKKDPSIALYTPEGIKKVVEQDRKNLNCTDDSWPNCSFKEERKKFRPTSYENIKKSGGQTKTKKK